MSKLGLKLLLMAGAWIGGAGIARAFELQYTITNPGSFTANQLAIVNQGLAQAKTMWETVITGYQPGISIPSVPIQVQGITSGLADAVVLSSASQGGFQLTTSGRVRVNINEVENFANWQGHGANGLNFIDELMAHEIGHALGIGTLWFANGVYAFDGTYRYLGQHGNAAYRAEFDLAATHAPVENAGNAGTPDSHWDQLMRSSPQEGTPPPADPFLLDPRVGVTDSLDRDRALELMTGAIDPDYREPFLSRFTVESMRDLGYTVTAFEDFNGDGVVDVTDRSILLANMGMTGLQIDSIAFGDANRDRVVDAADLALWRTAAGVPEPSAAALAAVALLAMGGAMRRRRCAA